MNGTLEFIDGPWDGRTKEVLPGTTMVERLYVDEICYSFFERVGNSVRYIYAPKIAAQFTGCQLMVLRRQFDKNPKHSLRTWEDWLTGIVADPECHESLKRIESAFVRNPAVN